MVDVDRAVLAIEVDGVAAVRGVEGAALDHAAVRAALEGDLGEVAAQDVVAGVAAVAVHVVAPAEQLAVVVRLRGAALLVESGELGESGALGGDGLRGGGGRRRRCRGGRGLGGGSLCRRLRRGGLHRGGRGLFESGGLSCGDLGGRGRRGGRAEDHHAQEPKRDRSGDGAGGPLHGVKLAQRAALGVFDPPDAQHHQVDQPPDEQPAEGEELQQAGLPLAEVEAVRAPRAQQQREHPGDREALGRCLHGSLQLLSRGGRLEVQAVLRGLAVRRRRGPAMAVIRARRSRVLSVHAHPS